MLILEPEDLKQVKAGDLQPITDNPETSHIIGRLRKDPKLAGGEAAFTERLWPPCFVATEWGAFQLATSVTAESFSASVLGKPFFRRATKLWLGEGDCDG